MGIQFDPGTNVVNSTICRLKKKLEREGGAEFWIRFPLAKRKPTS
ncbi:MAG: hypothetical protein P1U87_12175 [Verrucomicrobiales bacterium]|nr:hypothetical protein [Verrucomicrobiales bacterium]